MRQSRLEPSCAQSCLVLRQMLQNFVLVLNLVGASCAGRCEGMGAWYENLRYCDMMGNASNCCTCVQLGRLIVHTELQRPIFNLNNSLKSSSQFGLLNSIFLHGAGSSWDCEMPFRFNQKKSSRHIFFCAGSIWDYNYGVPLSFNLGNSWDCDLSFRFNQIVHCRRGGVRGMRLVRFFFALKVALTTGCRSSMIHRQRGGLC